MKNGLYIFAYAVFTFVILRFTAPYLLSDKDTISVIAGVSVIVCWGLASAIIAKYILTKKEAK
jgi:hypothetical protein